MMYITYCNGYHDMVEIRNIKIEWCANNRVNISLKVPSSRVGYGMKVSLSFQCSSPCQSSSYQQLSAIDGTHLHPLPSAANGALPVNTHKTKKLVKFIGYREACDILVGGTLPVFSSPLPFSLSVSLVAIP